MSRYRLAHWVVVANCLFAVQASTAHAQEIWSLEGGSITLMLDAGAMERVGLGVDATGQVGALTDNKLTLTFDLAAESDLGFVIMAGDVTELTGLSARLVGELRLVTPSGPYSITELDLIVDAPELSGEPAAGRKHVPGPGYLELVGLKLAFDAPMSAFKLFARDVVISRTLAENLGQSNLTGVVIGHALIEAGATWTGGEVHRPAVVAVPVPDDAARGDRGTIGPDMQFCQLYFLNQFGRLGDIVGLSVATTSWNVGDENLPWFAIPSGNHPFIVSNLYRLSTVNGTERFEQLGQSWIKHGFWALDSSQCSTDCQATGQTSLGIGCTDTYSAGLNASQNGLGPRYEVDPWNRTYLHQNNCHMCAGFHSHNAIDHRLQVHDADLDPAHNPGATYYVEGYYVAPEDVNPMNSAAWKVAGVTGVPGGSWNFSVSPASVLPEIGFAIDAWTGASQTTLAQQVPVIEFESPDGRCVLGTRVTDMGGGRWHYEYALLNVDMDRKVRSFSLPVNDNYEVTDIGFHAVESHGEPYSNDPWTVTQAGGWLTWHTENNPLRWGTLYNFRFEVNSPPVDDTTLMLALFEPGAPGTIVGTITGPVPEPPDCNDNLIVDSCDIACGEPGGECDVTGCGGSTDCDDNGIPDECETDFDGDGAIDACDPDMDGDGVANEDDVCDFTPLGIPVDGEGRPLGDIYDDCFVDQIDFRTLQECLPQSGPDGTDNPHCADLTDFDGDEDTDLRDVAIFFRAYMGLQ